MVGQINHHLYRKRAFYYFSRRVPKALMDNVQAKLFQPAKAAAPLMSEANSFYLRLKGDGKDKVFTRAALRNANAVIETLGDKPINEYASSEAGKLRDALLNKGLAVTSI